MNHERIKIIRNWIAEHEDRFDMLVIARVPPVMIGITKGQPELEALQSGEFFNDCGTAACIAGTAMALYPDEIQWARDLLNFEEYAANIMELPPEMAERLFVPSAYDEWFREFSSFSLQDVTAKHAVAALDSILATGDFSWKEIMGGEQ